MEQHNYVITELYHMYPFEIRDRHAFIERIAAKEFRYIPEPVGRINHFIANFIGLNPYPSIDIAPGKSWRLSCEELNALFSIESLFTIQDLSSTVGASNATFAEQSWVCVDSDYKFGVFALGFRVKMCGDVQSVLEECTHLVQAMSNENGNKWGIAIQRDGESTNISYDEIAERVIDNVNISNGYFLSFLDHKHSTTASSDWARNYVYASIYLGECKIAQLQEESSVMMAYMKDLSIQDCLLLHKQNQCILIRECEYHYQSGLIVLNTEVLLIIAALLEKSIVVDAVFRSLDVNESVTHMYYIKLLTRITASPLSLPSRVYEICKESLCFKDDVDAIHSYIDYATNNNNNERHQREEKDSKRLNLGITILTVSQVLFALTQYLGIKDVLGQPVSQAWTYGSAAAIALMLLAFLIIVFKRK